MEGNSEEQLAEGDWPELELGFDGNAPEELSTPVDPGSVGKILALGKNFREHAAEFGEEVMGLNPSGMVKIARRSDEAGWNEARELTYSHCLDDEDWALE